MIFTKDEHHNMVDRWEVIGHKLVDEVATREDAEEYLRLRLLLTKYRYSWRILKMVLLHPYRWILAWKWTYWNAKRLVR